MVEPAVPFYGLRFRSFESEFSNLIEPEVRFRHFAHTMGSMLINKVAILIYEEGFLTVPSRTLIVSLNGKFVFSLSYILFLANTACGHVNTIMPTCEVLCQMKGVIDVRNIWVGETMLSLFSPKLPQSAQRLQGKDLGEKWDWLP